MEAQKVQPLIVAGCDGRAGGHDALVLARILAEALGDEVLAAYVDAGPEPERDPQADLDAAFAGSRLNRSLRRLSAASPAHALDELVAEERPRLLVVGSTHQSGWGRVQPGAVGERLLGHTACPLAITPRGFAESPVATAEHPLRVLAVGFDGTATAGAALGLAAEIAAAASGTVRVIAVGRQVTPEVAAAASGSAAIPALPDLQQQLADVVEPLPESLRAQPIYERGDPASILLERAEHGVDLLVIGSRSHTRAETLLLGGTAASLVRQAPCPVLVVPPA